MANKMTVMIYGIRYAITSTEDPAYVYTLAGEIDRLVTEMMHAGGMSVNQALVLAALSYLDASKKSEATVDNLRNHISDYADDAAKARMELAEARKSLGKNMSGAKDQMTL